MSDEDFDIEDNEPENEFEDNDGVEESEFFSVSTIKEAKSSINELGLALKRTKSNYPQTASKIDILGSAILDWGFNKFNKRVCLKTGTLVDKVAEKAKNDALENGQTIVSDIYIPVFEGNSITSSVLKQDCYAELLRKASDPELCRFVHPSFVSTLEALTEEELTYLRDIKSSKFKQSIYFICNWRVGKLLHTNTFPFFLNDSVTDALTQKEISFESMLASGLIERSENFLLINSDNVNKIMKKNVVNGKFSSEIEEVMELDGKNYIGAKCVVFSYTLNTFGKNFVKAIF